MTALVIKLDIKNINDKVDKLSKTLVRIAAPLSRRDGCSVCKKLRP